MFLDRARLFLAVVFVVSALGQPTLVSAASLAASEKCEDVVPESSTDQNAFIKTSGRHCLRSDFNQRWLYVFSEGGRRGPHTSALITILAARVELDMKQHSLSTSTYIDGIIGRSGHYDSQTFSRPLASGEAHRLVIHNGTIGLHNSDGKSSGIGVISPQEISEIHDPHTSRTPPSSFAKVEYVIENLTIKTGNTAALLMGDGIVVRNCTIEVDGPNALVIYGPNAIIENNRIVYRYAPWTGGGQAKPTPGRPPELRAAIYLRRATGAVIRGNTIEVKDTAAGASAVALVDSTSVRVEDNQISPTIPVASLVGRSSAEVRGNRSIGGLFGRTMPIPNADLTNETPPK